MNFFDVCGIDEFLKKYGYEKIDGSAGAFSNIFNQLNLDIPGGFQDINPLLFISIGEILGDIMSGNMPYNEANSVSNFFLLVGQILEAWSVQIQYEEIGPGRYYSPLYKNIENPYCNAEEFTKEIKKLNCRIDELERKIKELE